MAARPDRDGDPRLRLVYDESLRALQDQQESLNTLRSRAGQLLTAASVLETFLLGLGRGSADPPRLVTWVSAGAFVLLALLCVWIVLPVRGWLFAHSATVLLDEYVDADPPATIDEMHRTLAVFMERHWDHNQDDLLRKRLTALTLAAALLVVCILGSVLDLRGRTHGHTSRPGAAAGPAAPGPSPPAGPGQVRAEGRPAPPRAEAAARGGLTVRPPPGARGTRAAWDDHAL